MLLLTVKGATPVVVLVRVVADRAPLMVAEQAVNDDVEVRVVAVREPLMVAEQAVNDDVEVRDATFAPPVMSMDPAPLSECAEGIVMPLLLINALVIEVVTKL